MFLKHIAVLLFCALGLTALPSFGQSDAPPLTAEEFEAYTLGKILDYARDGEIFGQEEYLPNREVRWRLGADHCQEGHWYPKGPQICFTYADDPSEHCWWFWHDTQGLSAKAEGDLSGPPETKVSPSQTGLRCLGENLGV